MPKSPQRIRIAALAVALVALAAGVAACGSSDSKLSLVAYSTPQEAYEQLIPAFKKTAAGEGRRLQPVLRRLGRPGARGRGRAQGRRRRALARAGRRQAREGGQGRRELGPGPLRRLRHRLRRRARDAQGQPEEHQDLGRPGQARRRGDHAEPVHLRRRALERDGRLRRPARAGQDRSRRRWTTWSKLFKQRAGAGQERTRVAADVRRRQGRRAARLRERGDHRPAEGPGRSTTRSRTRRS